MFIILTKVLLPVIRSVSPAAAELVSVVTAGEFQSLLLKFIPQLFPPALTSV